MSRESNFINVVDALKTIATNHRQIHSFGFGDVANINTSGTTDYMHMWVRPRGSIAMRGKVGYGFNISLMEILQADLSSEADILNDTHQVCLDVLADLYINGLDAVNGQWHFELKIEDGIQLNDFTERFDENTAGWSFDVILWVTWNWSECDIPKN